MQRELISRRQNWLLLALFMALSLVIGAMLVFQPMLAWFLVAGLISTSVLLFPPYLVACSAVVFAVFSRLPVAWGIAPGFINFLHFPLAVASFLLALLAPHKGPKLTRLALGVRVLGVLSILSWIANGGDWLKPVLSWLLFSEPFLILYAVVKTAPRSKIHALSKLALGLAFLQIPFAFWQAATLGLGDVVQGTLVGQGAGAHVIGAITLMGVMALSSAMLFRKVVSRSLSHLLTRIVIIAMLFAVPVLSDAKQAIIAFIPGFALLLWSYRRLSARLLFVGSAVAAFVVAAGYLYTPLRQATNVDVVMTGLGGKGLSYQIVAQKMAEFPPTFLTGLGPGNSVSRTALAAQEGYIRSLPGGWVDLTLSPITAEILSTTAGFYLFASSSVWSGVSSWLGLFGDLGLLGVAAYLWLLWVVWQALGRRFTSWAYAGRAVLVAGVILGAVFSWLETPEFTLPWALYMSIGLISNEDAAASQSVSTPRR